MTANATNSNNGTVKVISGVAVVVASVVALYSWGARDARSAIVQRLESVESWHKQRVQSIESWQEAHLLLGAHHEAAADLAAINQKFAKVLAEYKALQKEMDAAIRFFEYWRDNIPATDSRQDTKLVRIEEDIRDIKRRLGVARKTLLRRGAE